MSSKGGFVMEKDHMIHKKEEKICNIAREDCEKVIDFFLHNLYTRSDLKLYLDIKNRTSIPNFLKPEVIHEHFGEETAYLVERHLSSMHKLDTQGARSYKLIRKQALIDLCHYPILKISKEQGKLLEYVDAYLHSNGDLQAFGKTIGLSDDTLRYQFRSEWLTSVLNAETYNRLTETVLYDSLIRIGSKSDRTQIYDKVFPVFVENQYDISKTAQVLNMRELNLMKFFSCPHITKYMSLEGQKLVKEKLMSFEPRDQERPKEISVLDSGYRAFQERHDIEILVLALSYVFPKNDTNLQEKFGKTKEEIDSIFCKENISKFFNDETIIEELLAGIHSENEEIHPVSKELLMAFSRLHIQLSDCTLLSYGKKKEEFCRNLETALGILISVHRRGGYISYQDLKTDHYLSTETYVEVNTKASLQCYLMDSQIDQYFAYLKEGRNDIFNPYFHWVVLPEDERKELLVKLYYERRLTTMDMSSLIHSNTKLLAKYTADSEFLKSVFGDSYEQLISAKNDTLQKAKAPFKTLK